MQTRDPILEFDSATLEADGWHSAALDNFSLSLHAGELALIRFDARAGHGPISDAAMGLIEPSTGCVRFMGHDWQSRRAPVAAKDRGKIGRYFGKRGWVYHLDLDENVTLRERHHSHRPVADIYAEADRLAKAMGLTTGVPTARPGRVEPIDLQRSACVRMLLGSPPLVVIDEPTAGLISAVHEPLIKQVNLARHAGAAVLWLTADLLIWENQSIEPTVKIDPSRKRDAVNRLDTAFGLAFDSPASNEAFSAGSPQVGR